MTHSLDDFAAFLEQLLQLALVECDDGQVTLEGFVEMFLKSGVTL